jgi:hypothetical protein
MNAFWDLAYDVSNGSYGFGARNGFPFVTLYDCRPRNPPSAVPGSFLQLGRRQSDVPLDRPVVASRTLTALSARKRFFFGIMLMKCVEGDFVRFRLPSQPNLGQSPVDFFNGAKGDGAVPVTPHEVPA